MANLINAHKLSKEFAGKKLFDSLNVGFEEGERVGLIGPNGAGKSTLLKILGGIISADRGDVARKSGIKVSYLAQMPDFDLDKELLDSVMEGLPPNLEEWEAQMKALEALAMLNLEEAGLSHESKVSQLSGGWRKKLAIVRELAKEPDILFMDEPTNHLDVDSILWLEELLNQAKFAYVVITHDRVFLQNVTNRIIELDPRNEGGIFSINGDYTDYLEAKADRLSAQNQQESNLKNKLRRETEWMRRGPKARSTKQQARMDRHGELAIEVADISDRNRERKVNLSFKAVEGGPKKLIEAIEISKAFQKNKKLFEKLTITISKKSRIGLLGKNGAGKSTLIKTLLGEMKPDSGEIKFADHIQVAYFEQNRELLDPEKTLLKTICPQGDHVKFRGNFVHIRSYLDRFMFHPMQSDLPVKRLSGGEQARILIAQLMLKEANILVLDEPTNDLDVATLDLLQEQLEAFDGALLLVTHDRYFLDQVCDQILVLDEGRPEIFSSLNQWEEARLRRKAKPGARSAPTPKAGDKVDSPLFNAQKKKLGFNEQRELDGMEANIEKRESEMDLLVGSAGTLAGAEQKKAFERIAVLQKEIEKLYLRWEELQS